MNKQFMDLTIIFNKKIIIISNKLGIPLHYWWSYLRNARIKLLECERELCTRGSCNYNFIITKTKQDLLQ